MMRIASVDLPVRMGPIFRLTASWTAGRDKGREGG
jgi:hypothetical protein